jgi:hypothetical protein
MGVFNMADQQKVERLLKISEMKPIDHRSFVPWERSIQKEEIYLPEYLISLQGHELWDTLTADQQKELGRLEVIQVVYSYAWSEGMACLFFNKELVKLNVTDVEYRFLLREIIEEMQHQEMFSKAITHCNGNPVPPSHFHKLLGNWTVSRASAGMSFMSVIAVELLADVYAFAMRSDQRVYPILSKVSELHEIEEGRHIYYAKLWLQYFTQNASYFTRTIYSINMCLSIWFMRNLYVKKEFFQSIGVDSPNKYYKAAKKQLKIKYKEGPLHSSIQFVKEFRGDTFIAKVIWKLFHGVNL